VKVQAGLYQVITFAAELERGNPAYVVTEPGRVSDARLSALCATLGAGVLATIDGIGAADPLLRFFTSERAHPGAGHSTLAAAHVAMMAQESQPSKILFRLADGDSRVAERHGSRISVRFPTMEASPVDRRDELGTALGAPPVETFVSPFGYTAVLADQESVAQLAPDLSRIAAFDRNAVIVTAPGDGSCDCVISVFAPRVGLPEDPVCGTAHRIIIPYWSQRLGRTELHSRHLSPRGGDLYCTAADSEVTISGETRLVFAGTVQIGLP
jgi:PhzF family phenazine biosynthesis protein